MKSALFVTAVLIFTVLTLNIHMVRTQEGLALLWKEQLTLKDTYLDARDLGMGQLATLPTPVRDFLVRRHYEQFKQGFQSGQPQNQLPAARPAR